MPEQDEYDVILDQLDEDPKKRNPIPEIDFSTLNPDDYDLAFEGEGDDEEEDIDADLLKEELALLKKQNEELLKKSDSTSALTDSFQELAKSITQNQQQVQIPEQQPKESDEEFFKRINDGLFEGDAAKLLQEFYDRKMAPERNQQMVNNLYHSRKEVEHDSKLGAIYKKYKPEIETLVQQTPFETKRLMPDIYERAARQVAQEHMDELMDETMTEQVTRKVAEELKKYGIDPEKTKDRNPKSPIFSESNLARPTGKREKGSGPVKMRFTNKEKDFMMRKGMKKEALAELFLYKPEKREQIEKGLI